MISSSGQKKVCPYIQRLDNCIHCKIEKCAIFDVSFLLCSGRMQYDPTLDQYSNAKGVDIRIPGFGNTSTVEVLDPGVAFTDYFKAIVSHFASIGYTRDKDIRAAPFDWRLGPSE